jgi:hypothetical protein
MHENQNDPSPVDDDRRKFLAKCGKFAVVTPPAITVLLSTSLNSQAIASSSGQGGGNQGGQGQPGQGNFWDWLEKLLDKWF